jgi:hypothetical protein
MTLKPDQRALLQLLCERGQSYSDLAGLLDISEDQVRARARSALTELGGADPDAEVGLADYLLGQADPIGRADAVRFLQQDAGARELATDIVTKLQAIAPSAELPKLPEPRGKRRGPAAPSPAEAPRPEASAQGPVEAEPAQPRSVRQTRLIAGIAGAGVILLFVILGVAGAFSGDDGTSGTQAAAGDLGGGLEGSTTIELEPRGGSGVAGEASFGVADDTLFADLDIEGLDPQPARGQVYVLWLMVTGKAGYPVQIISPDESGRVRERVPIPGAVAVTVGSAARFVEVSESPARPLQRVIDRALASDSPLVPFSGESLARGEIPLAEGGSQQGNGSRGGGGNGSGGG